jgi:hypothetical protein
MCDLPRSGGALFGSSGASGIRAAVGPQPASADSPRPCGGRTRMHAIGTPAPETGAKGPLYAGARGGGRCPGAALSSERGSVGTVPSAREARKPQRASVGNNRLRREAEAAIAGDTGKTHTYLPSITGAC